MKAIKLAIIGVVLMLAGCISDDFGWVNSRSQAFYASRGFKVTGYQGYNMWAIGRCYWYTLERDGTIWESCLLRWGDEIHEYSLKALNAVKGN